MRTFCRCRYDGAAAHTCFIGINASLNAPGNSRAKNSAKNRMLTKCGGYNHGKDTRQFCDMHTKDNHSCQNINTTHHRRQPLSNLRNTFNTAVYNNSKYHTANGTYQNLIHRKCFFKNRYQRIDLNSRHQKARSQNRHNSKNNSIRLAF